VTRSYDFDRFPDPRRRSEIARLQRQAGVLIERELTMLEALGLRPDARFLELGCGPGFLCGAVAGALAQGCATGLDASADLLAVARSVVLPEHPNLVFVRGEAAALPFADASFDFAYSRLVFQHLAEPGAALRELRRVLRPGGRLCVLDIDDGWLSLHPPCAAFEALHARACEAKLRQGGDRKVGRKLGSWLRAAGFYEVGVRVEALSSIDLGIEDFLDLTTRFKAQHFDPEEGRALLAQLDQELRVADHPVGLCGIFVASGRA